MDNDNPPKRSPTLGAHFRRALRDANHRRPMSFYLLLSVPVVLILGAGLLRQREHVLLFTTVVSLLFVYFGVIAYRAIRDMFDISRRHLGEHRDMYMETLGQREFIEELGQRVGEAEDDEGR